MNDLLKEVRRLKASSVGERINKRLKEFRDFKNKPSENWFSELCFCILTANSKAVTAIAIQNELGFKGFSEHTVDQITKTIRKHGHRFHNNKAKYIVEARDHIDIKWIISGIIHEEGSPGAREWIAENVKGIGYKEASHFLRNVGFTDIAILDRHVINLMVEHRILKSKPKNLNRKNYLSIEKKFGKLCEAANMNMAELDMYMWYIKAGDVLK